MLGEGLVEDIQHYEQWFVEIYGFRIQTTRYIGRQDESTYAETWNDISGYRSVGTGLQSRLCQRA
ncbi:MAG: hypothetical protein M2R45_01723 [Verrucomicrobia subdivision 3 bacterium]|nr:hypothetical protein [Limisphaerales bacterium]MCS1413460.1 hypothetical protein [Limisphaerales bacterium]